MLPPSRLRRDEMTETAAQESHGGAFPDRWNGCVKAFWKGGPSAYFESRKEWILMS